MANETDGIVAPGAPIEPTRAPVDSPAPAPMSTANAPLIDTPSPAGNQLIDTPAPKYQAVSDLVSPRAQTTSAESTPRPQLSVVQSAQGQQIDDILDSQQADQKQALTGSLYVGSQTNPDRQAEILRIAKRTKVPPEVVARNFDQFAPKSHDDIDVEHIIDNSPKLAQWLSNPENAKLAHDDVPGLQGVEQTTQDHGVMIGMMHALESGTLAVGSQLSKIYAIPFELANARLNVGLAIRGQADKQLQPPSFTLNNPFSRFFDSTQADVQAGEPLLQINTRDALHRGDWKKAALGIAAQAVQGAPQIAAVIGASALAGPEAAAFASPGFMGSLMASGANAESLAEGNSVNTSLLNALGKGAVGAGGAHVLSTGILNKIGAEVTAQVGAEASRKVMSGVLANIALATGVEGANNTAMQFGNDFVDYVTGTKKSPFEDAGAKAAESFLVGGLTGGFLAAPGAYGSAHAQRLLARRAEFNSDFIQNLKASVDQTKLNQRAPEQSAAHTEQVLSDTPVENLLVNPAAVDTYFQSKKLDTLTEMQKAGLLKEYTEATEAGRDMQIKTSDFVHKMTSEHVTGLKDDIKFDPNELSKNESKAQSAETKNSLEQLSAQVPEDGEQYSREDSADQVRKSLASQIVETGVYSRQIADKNADLQAQRYLRRAEILGENPLDLYNRDNLKVVRADGEILPKAGAYNQDQTSDQNALGFYSALNREVNKMDFKNIPAKDLLNRIQNMQGLKKEEIENSGLADFLNGKEKVSKAEVQDYLRGQQLDVEEITHGGNGEKPLPNNHEIIANPTAKPGSRFQYLVIDKSIPNEKFGGEIAGMGETPEAAKANFQGVMLDRTQYSKYKLPGGENYREVLFKLPDAAPPKNDTPNFDTWAMQKGISSAEARSEWQTQGPLYEEYVKQLKKDSTPAPEYKSSHFEEKNILAHTRLTDRVDAEGNKVLHAEEIQSDWHQDGRKKGYVGDALPNGARVEAEPNERLGKFRVVDKDGNLLAHGDTEQAAIENVGGTGKGQVPDAPFKKTWHEFVLKRLIRMAAEGGYDKLTWSTGDQSADHYDLAKYIDRVQYSESKREPGKFNVIAYNKEGRDALGGGVQYAQSEQQIEAMFGKEVAKRISNGEGEQAKDGTKEKALSGLQLSVGGEGMRGFYDKILPDYLKKYGKKFGAEVGETDLAGTADVGYEGEGQRYYVEESEQTGQFYIRDSENDDGVVGGEGYDSEDAAVSAAEKLAGKLAGKQTLKVHSLEITPALRDAVLKQGQPLYQSDGDNAPRAQIEFKQDGVTISLGKDSNLSSYLHEGGHLWLKQMGDDYQTILAKPEAERTALQNKLIEDAEGTLNWLGVKSFDDVKVDQHEKFARGTELFLREGKAPSARLRQIFADFSRWLSAIYKHADDLNVELTPEMREIFGRLLASQDAIDAAEHEMNTRPLFNDPKALGLSDAESAKYTDAVARAHQAGVEQIERKVMDGYRREQTARYKETEKNVRAEIEKQVNEQPDQVALSILRSGKFPDGEPLPEGSPTEKLSKAMLVEQFGKDVLKDVPRGTYQREGGLDPRGAALRFGFESAPDLIEALKGVEKKSDLVDRLTEERMRQEHGDLLTDGSMPEEALKAYHNEDRAKLLRLELEHLVKNDLNVAKTLVRKVARRAPDLAQVREHAETIIGQRKVRDTNPLLFQRAETKASREATEALTKGDMNKVFEAKQRELLNHELWRAAVASREAAEAGIDYMQKFKKASKIEQLGRTGYIDQINAIRARFEFANVSQKELDRREQSLNDFITKIQEDGDTAGENVFTPDVIRNELTKTNYKNLTNEELKGVVETVKQLEHMAIQNDKLLTLKNRQRKADIVEELINGLKANLVKGKPRPFSESGMSASDRATRFIQQGDASLIKMEQLFKTFDGGNIEGPWSEIFHGAAKAQDAERDYQVNVTGQLVKALMNIPKDIQKRMDDQIKVPGIDRVMTRRDLIGVALNSGNEGNYTKLKQGHGWSDDQIKFMHDQLSEGEIKFVNGVHKVLQGMWPDIAKLQKKLTGLEPDQIATRSMQLKNGTLEGGYYPLMYDSLSTPVGEMQLSTNAGKLVEQGYTRATTPKGHTKARTGYIAPIDLDIGRLPSHISGVIKDLTHREWLMDANFIVNNREIREAIADHYGEPYQRAMSDWVKAVVNSRNAPSNIASGFTNKVLNYFRQNAMLATMGLSLKTILSHYGHAAIAADTVGEGNPIEGAKYMRQGFSQFVTSPFRSAEMVHEKSGEMRHFIESLDRDFSEKLYNLRSQTGLRATIQKTSLQGIHWAVESMAIPTWLAGYNRAIVKGLPEDAAVRAADSAVRLSLGASAPKDRAAAISSDNALLRVMTMFSTPISAFYNRQRDYGTDVANVYRNLKEQGWDAVPETVKKDIPRLAVRPLFIYAATSLLSEIWSNTRPSFDDSKEEWGKWLAEHVALMPFMGIPGVREVVSAVGHGRDFKLSPLVDVGESAVRAFNSGKKYAEGDGEFDKFAEDAFKASGYIVGLPTNQMAITGQYLKEVANGTEHPDSVGEFAYRSLMRKPKH